MNEFEKGIVKYMDGDTLKKVQSVRIGIAGAGGLGSNCASSLVRSGFKKFTIADFDKVDHSNLNRQFYFLDQVGADKADALKVNLQKINPDLDIESRALVLDDKNIDAVFKDCGIVVEAFDRPECKSMLVKCLLKKKKLIVTASGLAGYSNTDEIKVKRIKENLVMVGDLKEGVSASRPPLAPRVNVAAAKQADVVLSFVLNEL
jgi:sulfur carrier protein ThiS adenylyltransferase